ncbi:hypothetical protein HED60_04430 [Planctomycetales bacterium ZRK34]|nr:hypothetical protein HED60_04430 [Planctomycetales bacterium ZRK34]
MTSRRSRNSLWLASAVTLVGAAGSIVLAIQLPLAVPRIDAAVADSTTAPPDTPSQTQGQLDAKRLQKLWNLQLRRPLHDPPPPAPKAPPPPPPPKPLNVRLIGTIIGSSHSKGLFDLGGGNRQLLAVGQAIETTHGPAEIRSITPKAATVHFDNREITLEIVEDGKNK